MNTDIEIDQFGFEGISERPESLRKISPPFDTRLQIKLSPQGRDQLDTLVSRIGADGISDVIRDALRVYDIITNETVTKGNDLIVYNSSSDSLEKLFFWPRN